MIAGRTFTRWYEIRCPAAGVGRGNRRRATGFSLREPEWDEIRTPAALRAPKPWNATDVRLIDFFRTQVPASADEVYGLEPATAGAPRTGGFDALLATPGFGSDVRVGA
jgi:hypothetical protein